MRGWLNDVRSYVPPVAIGGVMRSFTGVSLLMEGRTGITAAMMSLQGYDAPTEIIFGVQLKPVTMDSCRTDIPPDGSPSSS